MKKNKVIVNYVAELTYNIILVIMPLMLTPYISRTIGPTGIGRYGFVQSITIYFISFANLGTSLYAQREIAMICGNREKECQIISDIMKIRIVMSLVSAVFLALLSVSYTQYKLLLLIQIIYVAATALDVTWYYYGIENYVSVVFVLVISRIVSFVLTFILVNSSEDVWKYALIFALCEFVSQFILAMPVLNILKNNIRRKWIVKSRMKSILLLFVPQIANQIYSALDRTMIVALTGSEAENGYYEQAVKIVAVVRVFLVDTLSFVMLPRVAKQFADNNEGKIRREINITFDWLCFIMWPLVFGIVGISRQLVPWFLGEEFLKSEILVNILAFNLIFVGVYTITGNQLLVPIGKYTEYAKSIIIGTFTNAILNIFMIQKWGCVGACYSSLISNVVIALYQMYHTKEYFSLWKNMWREKKSFFASIVMYIILSAAANKLNSNIGNTIMLTLLSAVIYIIIMILFRDKMIIWIWNMLSGYMRKK